jgi:hypothetical protein
MKRYIQILYFVLFLPLYVSINKKNTSYALTGSFGGFFNRIRVLTSYIHITSNFISNISHLYFTWDINTECPGHFHEVFQPLSQVTFIRQSEYDMLTPNALYTMHPNFTSYKTAKEIFFNQHNITYSFDEWHKIRRQLYQLLKPSHLIEVIYKTFIIEYNICNTSAIHIRKTDLNTSSTDNDFYKFIDSRPIDEKVRIMNIFYIQYYNYVYIIVFFSNNMTHLLHIYLYIFLLLDILNDR